MWQTLLAELQQGDIKALARSISLVENEAEGYDDLLRALKYNSSSTIIGVTGPPGAGKSTLVDGLISELAASGEKLAVLCVDPSSPFNQGAVLGDRIRMREWYNHPNIFIRSLATRGSLGGLHPWIIEITDLLKAAGFNRIIIETVGVGQTEVEIAGLADQTIVVLVPEGGDEIQTMKSGLMEVADVFVVNKYDRPGADTFVHNLQMKMAPAFSQHEMNIPIFKVVASEKKGIKELAEYLKNNEHRAADASKKLRLLAERAYYIIRKNRMKDINRSALLKEISNAYNDHFNLYRFVDSRT
jgi:LAO/AO transport system kinase